MSTFTDAEVEFLNKGLLGHLATVGPDGVPHVVPLGVWYDPENEAIVVGGYAGTNMAASKKFRDARRHPDVAVVVDDPGAFIEIRGRAETHKRLGADMPFDPAWILIRPRRIVTMGIYAADEVSARNVT
jgi:pyridoxamine 5'-phosphate oxidase family protein